jgi:hypothetical protein
MRQELWLRIGPMDPLPHPPIPQGWKYLPPLRSDLRLAQLAQRLRYFWHRLATQLSHAHQQRLYGA